MAIKVATYKWFSYHGRELIFPTGHPDHELHLFDGEIFGYKKFKDKHYLVDKSNTEVRFDLKEKDATRLIKASKGWTGTVDGVLVQPGTGGKNRAPASAEDTGNLHFLEIDSSNLRAAVYDKKAKTLYVGFKTSPAVWAYLNVTKKEATDLEEAPSQGRYFIYKIREVKAQHRVRSMPTPEEPAPEVEVMPTETPAKKITAPKKPAVKKAPAKVEKPVVPEVPKNTNTGKHTVALKLSPKQKEEWQFSEEGSWEDHDGPEDHPYSIIKRGKVQNEKELLKLLWSADHASFDEASPRVHEALMKKLQTLAKDYPFSEKGMVAYKSFGRPGFNHLVDEL